MGFNAPPAGVLCGAAASGQFEWTPEDVAKSLLCMVMSGPLLTGYTQARTQPSFLPPLGTRLPFFAF